MQYFITMLLTLVGEIIVIRTLTVALHELGHAIPMLLFTREKVTIYIGSMGDPEKSFRLNLGLLEVWCKYDLLLAGGGLCMPSNGNVSINKQIIYTLGGPLASFMLVCLSFFYIAWYNPSDVKNMTAWIIFTSSILDFGYTFFPSSAPIKLYNGSYTYNDGYQLRQLFQFKRFPKEFREAMMLFDIEKYAEAAELFNTALVRGKYHKSIYQYAISSNLHCEKYDIALELHEEFVSRGKLTDHDLEIAAYLFIKLGRYDEAAGMFDQLSEASINNRASLNNKGYVLNILERYEEAIPLFDKAIQLDANFAIVYTHRGLSKIKTGSPEEGLKDIHHSLTLDKDNAYAYRNIGIYHLDIGEFDEALKQFQRAKELDPATEMIGELMDKAERKG